ncbi:MAG: DUF1549 and DUF1553 domain-containing protein [Planctomycetaceae bacterium]
MLLAENKEALSPEKAAEHARELAEYDAKITPDDRAYWAYRPLERVAVPSVRDSDWCRNPIDNFVLAKLEEKGWKPSPAVEHATLLRRIHLDLIGLPPTPEQQNEFAADESLDAYEKVVDALLADPGHGERWARHWLDLARYAETNGYERDAIKPHAWRYRDYVIGALNADKPYDRFVHEQIAGDELPEASTETVIATGFNRLGPWDDEPAEPEQDRSDQLDDIVRTTSQVFLGMTVGCARCHDHKFDPISMHDYYRMVAVFDTLQRPQNGRTELDRPAGSREANDRVREREQQVAALRAKIEQLRNSFRTEFLSAGRSKLPADVIAVLATEPPKRTPPMQDVANKYAPQLDAELAAAMPSAMRDEIDSAEKRITQLIIETPDLPAAYFLHETSPALPKTPLLYRGRATNPGPLVQPGVPAVLVSQQPQFEKPDQHTSRQRISFARWMTSSDNPIAARVIVNRVWQFHFGDGIVPSSGDFGVMGQPPTHPELLDWLANWFSQDAGWSLKKLHRLIVTSSTYRMSKRWNETYGEDDPENELLWRFPYRRLEVETIRDSMLAATGMLDRRMYGESVYLSVPKAALEGHSDPGVIWKPFDEKTASRRTVYAFIKRSLVVPMLEVLDLCDTTRSSDKRAVTSVPTQALTLYNGDEVNRQARHLAERLQRETPGDAAKQLELAYRLTLCRSPSPTESAEMQKYLREESTKLQSELDRHGKPWTADGSRSESLVRLCRVILNLNEFVYVD